MAKKSMKKTSGKTSGKTSTKPAAKKSTDKNVDTFSLRALVNNIAGNGAWESDGGRRLRRALRKSDAHRPVGNGGKHDHRAPWTCVAGDRDHTTMTDVIRRVYKTS